MKTLSVSALRPHSGPERTFPVAPCAARSTCFNLTIPRAVRYV